MFIVNYKVRVGSKIVWFWIRPEFAADTAENATRFDSAVAASNYVEALEIPGLCEIRVYDARFPCPQRVA